MASSVERSAEEDRGDSDASVASRLAQGQGAVAVQIFAVRFGAPLNWPRPCGRRGNTCGGERPQHEVEGSILVAIDRCCVGRNVQRRRLLMACWRCTSVEMAVAAVWSASSHR